MKRTLRTSSRNNTAASSVKRVVGIEICKEASCIRVELKFLNSKKANKAKQPYTEHDHVFTAVKGDGVLFLE